MVVTMVSPCAAARFCVGGHHAIVKNISQYFVAANARYPCRLIHTVMGRQETSSNRHLEPSLAAAMQVLCILNAVNTAQIVAHRKTGR